MTVTVVLVSFGVVVFTLSAMVTWLINLVVEQGNDIKALEGRLGKLQRNTGALDGKLTARIRELEDGLSVYEGRLGKLQRRFEDWIG
jgi:hypothetical protein